MAVTTTNVKIDPCDVTWNAVDLGAIDGDVEISFEETTYEVKAQQFGSTVLDEIRTGGRVSTITLTLLETSKTQLQTIFEASQDTVEPVEGDIVIGFGNSKQFDALSSAAQKLVFHPKSKSGADLSEDLFFWKAYPMVDSISVSGENPRTVSVSFKIFPDRTKNSIVEYGGVGDHTQTLTV